MSSNEKEESIFYKVNHRYKEKIIVPLVAIDKFYDFIMTVPIQRRIITADGIKCDASKSFTENICKLEDKVVSLYGISVWDFIKKWYAVYPDCFYSLEFVVLELHKIN